MSTLSHLRARGTGPVRMRAYFKLQTQALTQAAARLATERDLSARLVNTPLPDVILGSNLLAILSSSIQSLLQADDPLDLTSLSVKDSEYRFFGPTAQRDGSVTSLAQSNQPANTPAQNIPANRKTHPSSKSRNTLDGKELPVDSSAAGPLLTRELVRYFRAEATAVSANPSNPQPHPTIPDNAPTTSRDLFPSTLDSVPSSHSNGRSWSSLNEWQIAGRLSAFVNPNLASQEEASLNETRGEGDHVEVNNSFQIQVGGLIDSTIPLQELSDQIAEILRQQAINHGIDVT